MKNLRDPYVNLDATMAYPMTDAEKVLDALKGWLSERIEFCKAMQVSATSPGHDTWRNRQDAIEEVFYFLEDKTTEELLAMYKDK